MTKYMKRSKIDLGSLADQSDFSGDKDSGCIYTDHQKGLFTAPTSQSSCWQQTEQGEAPSVH